MPHQLALNIIATVKPDRVAELKDQLGTIREHVDGWDVIPFARLANVHFARLIVFDATLDLERNELPPRLALLTNYDAPQDEHIRELASTCGAGLDQLFGHCVGYPDTAGITAAQREAFLREHRVGSRVDYINRQGRSVAQIRDEDRLRRAIDEHLDATDYSGADALEVHRSIVEHVRGRGDLAWALQPAARPAFAWCLKEAVHRVVYAALAIVLLPLALLVLPVFLLLLRRHEKRDVPDPSAADPQAVEAFRDDEDHWAHNQIVAAGLFKPGLFRALTARFILRLTDYAVRHIYNAGQLSGLNTIHFARWVPLDGNKRLFFSSNYDGSLESYMNDFIDKAAWGLNAIFSNGEGFPRTAFLFCGGITDEKAYKRYLPTRQVATRVWYSAYPYLTTKNIANNAAIRRGLSDAMSEAQAQEWLNRFGVGNRLPESGAIARFFDNIRWDQLCARCK